MYGIKVFFKHLHAEATYGGGRGDIPPGKLGGRPPLVNWAGKSPFRETEGCPPPGKISFKIIFPAAPLIKIPNQMLTHFRPSTPHLVMVLA